MRASIRTLASMFALSMLAVGVSRATDVTFRVVDQDGASIQASFVELPSVGGALVANDGTISLAPDTYDVLVLPGLNGSPGGCCISRAEQIVVSGASQTIEFMWRTATLSGTLLDQAAVPIAGALLEIGTQPSSGISIVLPNGGNVTLPVTDDPSSTPIQGRLADGYRFLSIPAINGNPIGCCLYRIEPALVELTDTGSTVAYTWHMADLQLNVVDESSAPIPGALTELTAGPGGFSFLVAANGATVRVPVTEDAGGLALTGPTASGYGFATIPAIDGNAIGCCLYRKETDVIDLPPSGASVTHDWHYATLSARLEDQDGVLIPGARLELDSYPFTVFSNGTARRFPVTEDPDGLPLTGNLSAGYPFVTVPAINGTPIGCCLYRRETLRTELPAAGTARTFVWEYGKGTLHVVDGASTPVPGSFIQQSYLGEIASGATVAIPVNDDTGAPIPLGSYSGGYDDINLRLNPLAPASGPFEFELLPGKVFSPPFVTIAGLPYGLRFDYQPVTDLDGDGFNAPEDCDDSNAEIYPGAPELPGNPVDENCDATLACDSTANYRNHGAFVSCVARAAESLLSEGEIDEDLKDALVEAAARSNVGK